MSRSDSTILAFCCSVCEETYQTRLRCQQHCSQPRGACNRGRQPHEFATPVPIRVRIENTRARVVGGQVTRHQVQDGGDTGSQGGGGVYADGWSPLDLDLDEEPTDWPGINIYMDTNRYLEPSIIYNGYLFVDIQV